MIHLVGDIGIVEKFIRQKWTKSLKRRAFWKLHKDSERGDDGTLS